MHYFRPRGTRPRPLDTRTTLVHCSLGRWRMEPTLSRRCGTPRNRATAVVQRPSAPLARERAVAVAYEWEISMRD